MQTAPGVGVLVPQSLDHLGAPRDLLDLVQCQRSQSTGRPRSHPTGALPHVGNPSGAARCGAVGGRVDVGQIEGIEHLPDQRGLPDLPGPRHDLQEAARLAQSPGEGGSLGTKEAVRRITQCTDYSGA